MYRTHQLRNFLALTAIFFGLVGTGIWAVNQPKVLHYLLAISNLKGGWQLDVGNFSWDPLENRISIENISLVNSQQQKKIHINKAGWHYWPLAILRGKVHIDSLAIDGVSIELPRQDKFERKRLNITKLILLKNIELKEARISQVSMAVGGELSVLTDEIRFSLSSTLFGDTDFTMRIDGLKLSKDDQDIASTGTFQLKTTTILSKWNESFPYINSLVGSIRLQDVASQGLNAESLVGKISFNDGELKLKDMELNIDGKLLAGELEANTTKESFRLALKIDKPLAFSYLGQDLETFDTGGELSGNIELQGNGFLPLETFGRGRIFISHRFNVSPEFPATLSADVSWAKGIMVVRGGMLNVKDGRLTLDASVDVPRKRFEVTANGKKFPIESVFEKFRDPHLKMIFGPTDVAGRISGWGKNFEANVKGITYWGGYLPIAAERVESDFKANYDELSLKGKILSGSRQIGDADLKIKFGSLLRDGNRSSQITLAGSIDDYPVGDSLGVFGLAGSGFGKITITGPSSNVKGNVAARVVGGAWHGVPFDDLSTAMEFSNTKISFKNIELKLPRLEKTMIGGQLDGELLGDRFRLHGDLENKISMDLQYRYADESWTLSNISYGDRSNGISAKGSVAANGALNIKVGGRFDIDDLKYVTPMVREGSGVVATDLRIGGTTENPRITGLMEFGGNELVTRGLRLNLDEMHGSLRFDGEKIFFQNVTAGMEDGNISVGGSISHSKIKFSDSNISLNFKGIRYRAESGYTTAEVDGWLKLIGRFPSPELTGDITVLDGKYVKDFNIIDAVSPVTPRPIPKDAIVLQDFNPKMNLHVRNAGDMRIKNNVGDIWLNTDVNVRGTRLHPTMSGSIETVEGEIHYLGIIFDISRGFIEFREKYVEPYIEIRAQKEIGVYNVDLTLHGLTDNLQLDLTATSPSGPLEKRDVVSLIVFGVTEQERVAAAQKAGGQFATSMVAQSLTSLIERPLSRLTRLDVFRLEAADPMSQNISRLYVGKKLSDRLSVNLATDINTQDAVQTVNAEYLFTDHLLLKGSRSSDNRYEVNGTLRFRLR